MEHGEGILAGADAGLPAALLLPEQRILRVISLGAGVQSTTMALMAAHGEIGPMPDHAVFADTGDEPDAVYEHLKWLMSGNVLPFPVHITSRGKLSERLLAGDEEARVPFHVGHAGMGKRQCTRNYKLKPIRRKIRELLGAGPRSYIRPAAVESWIGISTDEVVRMRPSGLSYIVNRHPLIEKRMSRSDCEKWLSAHGYPVPPKSSCSFCPYRRNDQWRDMRDNDPAGWNRAVALDKALREPDQVIRFHGKLYVHRQRVPLDEVDLTEKVDKQIDLFGNDCEGLCGV